MNILVFDTSTTACTVALITHGQVFSRHAIAPRQHTAMLLDMIEACLLEANLVLSDLNLIAVGMGPGSFIGVRFAVSVAKSLAFSANLPVYRFSTLQLLAQTAALHHGFEEVAVAWDARMSEIYYGHYKKDPQGVMMPQTADVLIAPSVCEDQPCAAVGNAWQVYETAFSKDCYDCFTVVESSLYPEAVAAKDWHWSDLIKQATAAVNVVPEYFRQAVT